MAWTAKRRDLNLMTRHSGEVEEQKLTYIKTTDITATAIKSAVTGLVSKLSTGTYIDAEILDTYSLDEAAASEEG